VQLSIVIPTYRRSLLLERVLDALAAQRDVDPGDFEVIVVADPDGDDPAVVIDAIGPRPYPTRLITRQEPGVSGSRNAGWRAAAAPLVLFLDDDVRPTPALLSLHLAEHASHPEPELAVLGNVVWAPELRITPFMRWLERGYQFDYGTIDAETADWWHLYTANVSIKRELLERVSGFDADTFPFGYEDLDLGYRMHREGMRLRFLPAAVGEHMKAPTPADWGRGLERIARSERAFVGRYPDMPPYFRDRFAAELPRAAGLGITAPLARVVPRRIPWIGPRAHASAEARFVRRLAPLYLAAWERAEEDQFSSSAADATARANPSGSSPGGPK
jgi:GT2 family glycosyltransferase